MKWYLFDLKGLPDSIHQSLVRAFFRLSLREKQGCEAHLYGVRQEQEGASATYYLSVIDDHRYAKVIRQFGGKQSNPPEPSTLIEVQRDTGLASPMAEPDTAPC